MSKLFERRRRLMSCAIAAALILPRMASSQTVAEYTHRVDSLARIWKSATAVQVKADSSERERLPSDTIRVGNFVILADSAHKSLATDAAKRASPILDHAFGAFATRLRSRLFVLRPRASQQGEGPGALESGILDANGVLRLSSGEFPEVGALALSWQRKAEETIAQDLAPAIREWLPSSIPSDTITQKTLATDRVELVLSRSQAAHDCAVGVSERCLPALGLTPVDDPAFALFNESERLDMLQRNEVRFRRSDPLQFTRCTINKVKATCDSLVHSIPLDAVPWPTSSNVRRSLVRYALMIGGPGAFERLASTDGSASERIASAAKMPTDSVVRRWQNALMDSKGSSTAIDTETAASALFWAAACGALALRSSRWR